MIGRLTRSFRLNPARKGGEKRRDAGSILRVTLILTFFGSPAQAKDADLAGRWYSRDPSVLRTTIERYLDDANVGEIKGSAIGFLAPHAGLDFSGPVAAYTYKAAAAGAPDKVIIVGFSHRKRFDGVAILEGSSFVTPLGAVDIDRALSDKFVSHSPRIRYFGGLFEEENSVEMQIPFVQVAIEDTKVVLMAIGDPTIGNARLLSGALYDVLKNEKKYVIIGSTDMSHYLSYEKASERDKETIDVIKELDGELLYARSVGSGHELMCGYASATAVISACRKLGADRVEILKYANSGDTTGIRDRVVGYLSAAFVESGKDKREIAAGLAESEGTGGGDMLDEDQKRKLLGIARKSILYYLEKRKRIDITPDDSVLGRGMGAFVTLRKSGRLRGCIGHMTGTEPLYLTVRDMAIAAAVEDPRFPPVTPDEMKDIDIEISVLSPMEKIDDYNKIEMGKHGVMVRMGRRSGVYLPQVATETGWDRDAFMNSLSLDKAGIPADAWKTGACEIYVFTAEIFWEKEHE